MIRPIPGRLCWQVWPCRTSPRAEMYANVTRNYRAITFNDMRTVSPALEVNPDLKDETGFSSDIGIRSRGNRLLTYDVSLFFLYYGDRIGEYFRENPKVPGTYTGTGIISVTVSVTGWRACAITTCSG